MILVFIFFNIEFARYSSLPIKGDPPNKGAPCSLRRGAILSRGTKMGILGLVPSARTADD